MASIIQHVGSLNPHTSVETHKHTLLLWRRTKQALWGLRAL